MENQVKIPIDKAGHLLSDADILLFRAPKYIFNTGWCIARHNLGIHTHIAMANKVNKEWYSVEFREFPLSRNIPLKQQFEERPHLEIDVYRVSPLYYYYEFNPIKNQVELHKNQLTQTKVDKILEFCRSLVGLSYSYKLIFNMMLAYIPGFRLIINRDYKENGPTGFVCSTLIARSYRRYYVDLVNGITDEFTSPTDITRSKYLNYLFTLTR